MGTEIWEHGPGTGEPETFRLSEKHESWLLEAKEMVVWWRRSGRVFLGEGRHRLCKTRRHGKAWDDLEREGNLSQLQLWVERWEMKLKGRTGQIKIFILTSEFRISGAWADLSQ